MSSAAATSAYRVPAIVAWDDFIDAVRANGSRGFSYGAPVPTCAVIGCTGPCAASVAPRPAVTAPTPTPTPTPPVAPATPTTTTTTVATPSVTVVTADTITRTSTENLLFDTIVVNYYGLRKSARVRASYEDYKTWEATMPTDYIRSTTPYARITQYITVERVDWLQWNCIPGIEYDKMRMLGKMFPGRSLMEIKDIIFPLYQEWRKTAIFLPKMNRWQKMKQFAAEYATMF